MNRILKLNNGYAVLITPTYISSPSFELLLGNWSDSHLHGYEIAKFGTLQDAMDLAFKYPSIDWNKLINLHMDAYKTITNSISNNLKNGSFIVEIDSHLMTPTEFKETMFNRVMQRGERFNMFYDANDVISINIINPWSGTLLEISNVLKTIPELRIRKIIKSKTHITLIGITDVGTTYEIRLWTSLIAQWTRWIKNNNLDSQQYLDSLDHLIKQQKIIDDSDIAIR